MPNFAIPITVDTLAALALVHVAEIDNGTLAWVDATSSIFVLRKLSALVPNGTTVIAPVAGSPIAGAAAARWVQLAGAGSGSVLQRLYVEDQVRPTVYAQPAPGGVFATILSLPITTTSGTYLAINASLSALTDGGIGSTETEAAIRLLVDGVSTNLGSTQTSINDNNNLEPFVALTLLARVPLLPLVLSPGAHLVELQWMVQGDGAAEKSIGFLVPDQDGASMYVEEVL